MIRVFDSYDTTINIAELKEFEKTEEITNSGEITINNIGNKECFPVVEITTDSNATLSGEWLVNDDQSFSFDNSIELTTEDTLLLDFDNQSYKLNDNSIVDDINFPNNKIIKVKENKKNTFNVSVDSGSINFKIKYSQYSEEFEIRYIDSFRIDGSLTYRNNKLRDENYRVTISNMPVDWYFYDGIKSNKDFRIKYQEYNPDTFDISVRCLLGVNFLNWQRGFSSMGEFIITNLTGESDKLIKINQ